MNFFVFTVWVCRSDPWQCASLDFVSNINSIHHSIHEITH
uniref:Uncharacterized protein n=1 Tax=Anguilla anguilla TaxID=7936 RepID=A0A0E9PVN4_ANGAN